MLHRKSSAKQGIKYFLGVSSAHFYDICVFIEVSKKKQLELQISHILHPRIEWICEDELHAAFKGFKIYFISVQQNKSKWQKTFLYSVTF